MHFVIGGAQKSGTCTLDRLMRRHPGVQMASIKETHFFDDETRDWRSPNYALLESQFASADHRIRGEATPVTLYWRPALRRLADYNPEVKLVFLLRDPVERAFSHWRHEWAGGRETLAFAEAIRGGRKRVRDEAETEGLHRVFSYVERGLYGEQLAYVLDRFPARNVHCEIFEDFIADQSSALARIAGFLGVAPFPRHVPNIHANRGTDLSYPSRLMPEDRAYLANLFADDTAKFEALIGRSLAQWRGADLVRASG